MINFYIGSRLPWDQYLKAFSDIKDLKGQIRRNSKKEQMAISEQTREIVASNEALARKFAAGFDSINLTIEWGFGRLENAINGMGTSIDALRASFDYGIALVIEQLQFQSQSMLHLLQQMEAIHATLENPTLTQAREFYRIGCDRLAKGLLDKALEAFLESERKDDTNFVTQLVIGKLYLYGVNDDSNVLDLKRAELHLRAAARYAKAEAARFPEASRFAGEALLHASISCYAQANEQVMLGNTDEALRFLQASFDLAAQATVIHPQLSEGHYHHAKFAALLGDGKTAAASLRKAIELDDAYCLKADADLDFRFVLSDVGELFKGLRNKSADQARQKIEQSEKLLTDWVYLDNEAKTAETGIREKLDEAKNCLARNTYFDNKDAVQIVQESEQMFQSLLVHKFALQTLEAHSSRITSLAFSPDQAILASGGGDKIVRLWSLPNNELIFPLPGHSDTITELVFSHDGRTLASVDRKGCVKIWNVANGSLLFELAEEDTPVQCIVFSPDDARLAIGRYNWQTTLWDLHTGFLLHTLQGHKSSVDTVVFSGDGKMLATGSPDNIAALWEVSTGRLLHTFHGCSGLANCLLFGARDQVLIIGSNDGSVRFYEVKDGKLIHTLPQRSGAVSWLALSPKGDVLATINYCKALQLWDVNGGKLLHELKPFSPGITSVRFSPDGTILAASDYQDRSVKLWSVQDGKLLHVVAGNLNCSAFSPDGAILATGDEMGNIKFWTRMVAERGAIEADESPKAKPATPRMHARKPEPGRAASGGTRPMETVRMKEAAPRQRAETVNHRPMRPAPARYKEEPQPSAKVWMPEAQLRAQAQTEQELERLLEEQELVNTRRAMMGRCLECGKKLGFFAKIWGLKFCREHS
jgi:WD40 repeat protein